METNGNKGYKGPPVRGKAMLLLRLEDIRALPPLYATDAKDAPFLVKLFNPCGAGTWYLREYDPETRIAFGYVTGLGGDELGYISLDELAAYRDRRFGTGIERDRHFGPTSFADIKHGREAVAGC